MSINVMSCKIIKTFVLQDINNFQFRHFLLFHEKLFFVVDFFFEYLFLKRWKVACVM